MDALTPNLFSGIDADYAQIFWSSPLPMWVYDVQTLHLLAVNEAALTQYGYSKPEFLALSLPDLHPPEDAAKLQEHLKLPLAERLVQRAWRHRHCSGDLMDVEVVTQDIALHDVPVRLVMVRDLTLQNRAEQQQQEMAQRMATMLESMTDALFMLDREWRFTFLNHQAEKLLKCHRDELLGRILWEKYPGAVGSIYQIEYERAMAESCTVSFEAPDPACHSTWISVTAYPSKEGLTVYFRDITARRNAERKLHQEQRTFAAVINATADAVVCVDIQGCIKMFNPGAERIFQRSWESMHGKSIDLLLPASFRAAHRQHLRSFAGSGMASRSFGQGRRVKGLRSDGQELELEATISKVDIDGAPLLIACLRDDTERVRLDDEMQRSREQLSELTQHLITQERTLVKNLAQTLHDHLGQTIAAIRMAHETILTLQADQGAVVSTVIGRLQGQMGVLIGQAINQVRKVLTELRPPLLEEQGFAAALDNELRNRSLTQPQIDISLHVTPQTAALRWPVDVEYAAFMVAREAVENALRHSGSPSVSVSLSGSAASMQLEVADTGDGIIAANSQKTQHLGILGMHERAQMIGASVAVESGADKGTRVNFSWKCAA